MTAIIAFIIALASTTIIIFIVSSIYNAKLKREKEKISFKESMDLTELPIITFYIGTHKLNFILDSGSNFSFITPEMAKKLFRKKDAVKDATNILGCGAKTATETAYPAKLIYKDNEFKTLLHVNPGLTEAFAEIKKEDGIQAHGILGSLFLQKYKYILDFAELTAYRK